MEQKRSTLPYSFLIIVAILILHLGGLHMQFYWRLFWYDIIVHTLGGFWIALTAVSIAFSHQAYGTRRAAAIALGSALIMGIGWEFFELWAGASVVDDPDFKIDTIGDLINDMVGGLIAVPIYSNFFKK